MAESDFNETAATRIAIDALDQLRRDVGATPPPPVALIQARAARRTKQRRVRTSLVAAAAALLIVGGGVVAGVQVAERGDAPKNPVPGDSATQTPSEPEPTATVSEQPGASIAPVLPKIETIDLASATLASLPSAGSSECPTAPVKFTNGIGGKGRPYLELLLDEAPVYGDLNGDGRAEAVVRGNCRESDEGEYYALALVIAMRDDGSLHGLAWAGPGGPSIVMHTAVENGRLVLSTYDVTQRYMFNQRRTYTWNGTRFNQTAVSKPILLAAAPDINQDAAPFTMPATSPQCPGGPAKFDGNGYATVNGVPYRLAGPGGLSHGVDLDGDRINEIQGSVECMIDGGAKSQISLMVFSAKGGTLKVIDVPFKDDGTLQLSKVTWGERTVRLELVDRRTNAWSYPTLTWRGNGYKP